MVWADRQKFRTMTGRQHWPTDRHLVMQGLRPKALSRPKPALKSPAQPEPFIELSRAHGLGFEISKPKARARVPNT